MTLDKELDNLARRNRKAEAVAKQLKGGIGELVLIFKHIISVWTPTAGPVVLRQRRVELYKSEEGLEPLIVVHAFGGVYRLHRRTRVVSEWIKLPYDNAISYSPGGRDSYIVIGADKVKNSLATNFHFTGELPDNI